jgi:hypothetical protein
MDPFFKARDARASGPIGLSYLKDVHRTYNTVYPRQTYENALKFREREKVHIKAVVKENEMLRMQVGQYKHLNERAGLALVKLSKQKQIDDTSQDRRNDGSSNECVPHAQSTSNEGNGNVGRGVPGEVLRGADLRGQSDQHTDEGRQSAVDELNPEPASGDVQE